MEDDVLRNRSTIALLEKLGLSQSEVRCYLAALLLGPSSMSEIAARAGVHRVNAYGAVRGLIAHGLASQEMRGRARTVILTPLEHLEQLAQDVQKQTTKLRWRIADLIPELAKVSAVASGVTASTLGDVVYFRGDDAFYRIAERTLEGAPRESTILFIEPTDYFHPPDNPRYDEEYYIPRRLERDVAVRVLLGSTCNYCIQHLRSRDAIERRTVRILPPRVNFPCSTYIYGSEVAFVWTTSQTYGLIVRGGPIYALMQTVFEFIWEASSPAAGRSGRRAMQRSSHSS